jgi:plasmid maintenance system antidote protein VapI
VPRLPAARRALSTAMRGSSPDMAIRLPNAFGRSPESWLQPLPQYELWRAEQRSDAIKVKHFATLAPC